MSDHAKELAVDAPDRFGVVLGYRTWHLEIDPLTHARYSLRAANATGPWTKKWGWRVDSFTEAACMYSCDPPPGFDCVCGLHARYEPKTVEIFHPYNVKVSGAVLGWGRVIHHADQSFFRAQNMLPIALMEVPGDMPKYVRQEIHVEALYENAKAKLDLVGEALDAPIFGDLRDLIEYAREEERKW